jgi:hypothetical protein
MRNKMIILILTLLTLSGCENVANFEDYDYADFECDEMNKIGDITDLFKKLDYEVSEVQKILAGTDDLNKEARDDLHSHADKISDIGDKVEKLSKVYWTDSRVPYRAYWFISPKDFRNKIGPLFPSSFKFIDAEVENVYLRGKVHNELKDNFIINLNQDTAKHNSVYVEFNQDTSYLFSCQLKKTFLVILRVKAKNLFATKEYYINLVIGK